MGLSVTPIVELQAGGAGQVKRRVILARITGDSAYASNGEALTASSFGLGTLESIVSTGGSCVTGGGDTGRVFAFDRTAGKLVVLQAGTADAPLNDSDSMDDLSGITFEVIAVGFGYA